MIRIYRTILTTNGVFSSSLAENTVTEAELEQAEIQSLVRVITCTCIYFHIIISIWFKHCTA